MAKSTPTYEETRVVPATPERWPDLETLFGPRGACAGCWCMYWRLPAKAWEAGKGEGNKAALRALVLAGAEPGVIAYRGDRPAGWCAVAPREDYLRLLNSRILAPVDDRAVWSVVCFFIARPFRGTGLGLPLLKEAVALAQRKGAAVVEGYPIEPQQGRLADTFAYHGLASTFLRAGFREVARRSPTRPIMRLDLT